MATADSNTPPGIYCCNCGYDLQGQAGTKRCPECGQEFDPTDRTTFLTRPPCGALWRWVKRGVILLLAVAILLALCWGWLYWGWKNEQAALRKMRLEPLMHVAPLGGDMASQSLGSAGWVLNRVRSMRCLVIRNDGDMVCLKDFKWIDTLDLGGAPITDAGLVHLSDSKRLQELILQRTRITDAGLVHLGALKELRELVLWQTEVTPEGVGKLQATLPGAHISGP